MTLPAIMKNSIAAIVVGSIFCLMSSVTAGADDWPQWRGPKRNGISLESGWTERWPAAGPKQVWVQNIGEGYSSVAVVGGKVYSLGFRSGQDTVWCFDAISGKPIWRYAYPCSPGNYTGPRATPTVDGGRVYTLSHEGLALCLDAVSGKLIWQRNIQKESGAQIPTWGFAGSPLIHGNLVIYNVGPAGVAVDKNSGRVIWMSRNGAAGYSAPVAFHAGGKSGVAMFVASGVVAVDPASGKKLWDFPWTTAYDVNAADPIFDRDSVFISSNYGRGSAMLDIVGASVRSRWESRSMKNHFNSCILVGSTLFGNDEGTLRAIDAASGREKWSGTRMGRGGLIASDGKLLVMTDRGELVIVKVDANRYVEISRASVAKGDCWTHPVLSNGFLYVRSHQGELSCLDLRKR